MILFYLYVALISVLSVGMILLDIRAARVRAIRVPEIVLLLTAFLGGSVSMYITMLITKYKMQYPKFRIGIPVIFVLQICLMLFAVWRWSEAHS